jgi:O-antigen ligase
MGGLAAVFVGIAISLSRGALLAAFVTLALCIRAERRRLRLLVFVGLVSLLVMTFLPVDLGARVGTLISASGHGTLADRERLYRGGIEMAIHAFPFGVGLGNYWYHSASYTTMNTRMISHSSYIDLAAEGGIPAIFLFGGFVTSLFLATRTRQRHFEAESHAGNLVIGMRVSLISFLIGAAFLNATGFWSLWWLAGLIEAKASCDRELLESQIVT